jgi:hypothetical protein
MGLGFSAFRHPPTLALRAVSILAKCANLVFRMWATLLKLYQVGDGLSEGIALHHLEVMAMRTYHTPARRTTDGAVPLVLEDIALKPIENFCVSLHGVFACQRASFSASSPCELASPLYGCVHTMLS